MFYKITGVIQPTTNKLLFTGTFRMGTVIKQTSKPFKNIIDFIEFLDQKQLKYDGDDVVFTG